MSKRLDLRSIDLRFNVDRRNGPRLSKSAEEKFSGDGTSVGWIFTFDRRFVGRSLRKETADRRTGSYFFRFNRFKSNIDFHFAVNENSKVIHVKRRKKKREDEFYFSLLVERPRFFIMVFDQFVSGLIPVSFSLVFILMLELTSSSWTSFTANWAMVSYTIGEVFITFSAKISLDWQKLKCLETILMALWLPYLCFMPESPLFLHSKGDKVRLEKVLDRISKSNGREQSQWFSSFENLIKRKNLKDKENPSPENVSEMRRNALKISICALLGFTTLLVYIKLSFGLAEMNSSPFFSILLGALLEAISYVTCSLLISSRLGRKGSLTLMMSLTIVSLCLLPSFRGENSIFLGQIGKFSISGAIGISWTFVPESFPTSIRTSANGIFVASSRIGAIFTPIIETSIDENSKDFLLYSIGLFSTLVLILTLTLPETKNKSMDE